MTKDTEHILHCAPVEFYLIDNLREHIHSFENTTPLSNPQTGSHLQINYPQTMDYFSEEVSVIRGGGNFYRKHFGGLRVSLARLLQFVLEVGKCNAKRDGSVVINAGQRWHVTFGCAGQAHSKLVDGTSAPKQTYGFDIFEKVEDKTDRASIKQMVADVLDAMQDAKDEIEVIHLQNGKPFYCKEQTNSMERHCKMKLGLNDSEGRTLPIK